MTQRLRALPRLMTASALCPLLLLTACAAPGDSRPEPSAATQSKPAPIDPVQASIARERAIELLGASATSPSPQLRANALEALVDAPTRLEPLAAAGLVDENFGVRAVAAMTVGRAGLCQLAPSVRPLLSDPEPRVRASAIFALSKCGEPVDPTPLARVLLNDPNPQVRAHAAFVLGELGNPSALGLLREAARARFRMASQAEVRLFRLQVAEAMVKLGDEEQIQTISAALYPSRPEELEATALAVQIMGQLEAKPAIDQLIYLTAYEDQGSQMPAEVRLAAAASLAQLGLPQGAFIADQYADAEIDAVRAQSAFVYGQTGRITTLPKLQAMLDDPSPLVAVAAAAGVLEITQDSRSARVEE